MQQKKVALGGLELGARLSGKAHDDDEPRAAHREPAKDVWHHAPDVVERALRAHKVVAPLLGHGEVGVLDVVERPVLVPLVLREQLERARVGVVVGAPVVVLALAELVELVGADRVGVALLVDEGLRHRNVLDEEAEGLRGTRRHGYLRGRARVRVARAHHGGPVEHEDGRERVLLANSERDADRHRHEAGAHRILGPAPVKDG